MRLGRRPGVGHQFERSTDRRDFCPFPFDVTFAVRRGPIAYGGALLRTKGQVGPGTDGIGKLHRTLNGLKRGAQLGALRVFGFEPLLQARHLGALCFKLFLQGLKLPGEISHDPLSLLAGHLQSGALVCQLGLCAVNESLEASDFDLSRSAGLLCDAFRFGDGCRHESVNHTGNSRARLALLLGELVEGGLAGELEGGQLFLD